MDGHLRPGTDLNRGILLVLLASGLLKVLLAVGVADLTPRYDEVEFLEFGRRVAAGEAPVLWRAPGYQSFVAAGLSLAGGDVLGVRLLQVLLSIATTWFVYRLGRRLGGESVGLAAAAFLAFYPSHVAFSHLLWAETLFLFLIVLAFERVLVFRDSEAWRDALLAGALLGAASLVRSMGIPFLLITAAWLLWTGGRRPRTFALVAAAVVVMAPWSLSASVRAGRWVLVDTNAGWNLWSGHNEYIAPDLQGIWGTGLPFENGLSETWGPRLEANGLPAGLAGVRLQGEWRRELTRRLTEAGISDRSSPAADAWYRSEAMRELRRAPGAALGRVPRKLAALWSPDLFLPRHLLRDWYGPTSPALAAWLSGITWAAACIPLLLGPMALAALGRSDFRTLATLWIGAALAIHAVLFGVSRMHQPLVPFLVLAAAAAIFGESGVRWKRGAIAGAAALFLMVTSLPAGVGAYLVPGPRHAGMARALGAVRHLPIPGTRHTAWMLAEIEAANGRPEAAVGILEEPRHAGDAGTFFLHALVTRDPQERKDLVRRAGSAAPESELLRGLEQLLSPPAESRP